MDKLLLVYLFGDDGKEDRKYVIKRCKQYRDTLDAEGKRVWYNRVPRCALMSTKNSLFVRLFESGDDQALITATGVNHVTFEYIQVLFAPMYIA